MPGEPPPGLAAVATAVSTVLGVRLRLAAADAPIPPSALTAVGRARWHALRARPGRRDWLLGRAALRELVGVLGVGEDPSALAFPHPRLSLTHAGGLALAVGVEAPGPGPDGHVVGVGIDFEPARSSVDPRLDRFFLDGVEQAWVDGLGEPEASAARLRLWTVKEALFKANPVNAGTVLAAYRPPSPAARHGPAAGPCPPATALAYAAVDLAAGSLAVAVCRTAAGGARVAV